MQGKQGRSKAIVAAIAEGAARFLAEQGWAEFSTNAVAARAAWLVCGAAPGNLGPALAMGTPMTLRVLAMSLACLLAPLFAHGTDDIAAAERLGQSCEGGNTRDCGLLGVFYYSGRGVVQDYVRATQFYQRACHGRGDDFALFCSNLGHMYENGRGVEQDYGQAARLQQQACDAGYAGSCTSLGTLNINGRGLMQDYAQAAALFGQACEAGEGIGCRNLGLMHASGMGFIQDYARSRAV